MLYQNPIFYKRAFHRELSQAALGPSIGSNLLQTGLPQGAVPALQTGLPQGAVTSCIQAFHRELSQAALFFPQGAVTTCTLFNVDRELSQAALFSMVLRENFMQMILFYGIPPLFSQMIWYYGIPPLRKFVLWYSAPKKNAQERRESVLNCAFKLLANWCDNNGMVINTAKTAFQTFSLARHRINSLLRYKDTTQEKTNEFTYLGMTFENQ
ncbi:unnamed protein product [Rodentolepis nana]|uniref:Reverse transcriptase domain-containing protein n=1 Tax=Rodentolepis nana TaxID=102285 RepID=A0A0R3TYG1_RODNA|nr:unnamed protein product [Rodentolepis nana]